uniref:Uncharacterized protein n=1 Tax=Cebus imitator TaxID=2715852 RepID=A0A2K5Q8K7_CEBIM
MVNVSKTRRTFCKKCVTQYKKDKDNLSVITGSRVAMVGKLSRFSRKRLKLQRRLCQGLSALSPTADLRECWLLKDARILNW